MVRSLLGLLALLFMPLAFAAEVPIFATDEGAIRGYDPVTYFTIGEPTKGIDKFTASWQGATFKFTSAANLELFKAEPAAYAPQYGGFCALGMAHGGAVPTDPTAWTIYEDQLYLNMIPAVTITWRYNPDKLVPRADENWAAANPK